MEIAKAYETRLETSSQSEITPVLDAKLEATSPQRVVDYVSLCVDNLEANTQRMKDAKKELDAMIKENDSQIETIKIGVSEWLSDTGITSLKGDIVSSMKITQPKEKEELVITADDDTLINQGYFKTSLDKTAIKNAIKDGVNVEGAEIKIVHQQESLTIYKKRRNATDSQTN